MIRTGSRSRMTNVGLIGGTNDKNKEGKWEKHRRAGKNREQDWNGRAIDRNIEL